MTDIFERTRFSGTLSGAGSPVSVRFEAWVDACGVLQLEFDPVPASRDALVLRVFGRPGATVDGFTLEGSSEAGHALRSDTCHITSFKHTSSDDRNVFDFKGECLDAHLHHPPRVNLEARRDERVQLFRQLHTFRRLMRDTPLGRVTIGGARHDRETQEVTGFIAILRPENDGETSWLLGSEELLAHVARVMSFACDTYLRPVVEHRFEAGRSTSRVMRQSPASTPFMPPFHSLHLEPIFACACDSYFTRFDDIIPLDPAIRWLTAPVAYDESRLINVVSALESIIDRCGLDAVGHVMKPTAFRHVARRIRRLIDEGKLPDAMKSKIPELNRRTLFEKVEALMAARDIADADFPTGWLQAIVRQRNSIIHTGTSGRSREDEPTLLEHTIQAREIVTRIILERLGFVGMYRSWLHHDEQLHFPQCRPERGLVSPTV